jgi:hypothetical protein
LLNIVDDEKKVEQIEKYINVWIKEDVVIKDNNQFKINDNYKSTWSRIRKLVDTLGNQIFQSDKDPFVIIKNINGESKNQWITTTDMAFLTLFAFYLLIEEC